MPVLSDLGLGAVLLLAATWTFLAWREGRVDRKLYPTKRLSKSKLGGAAAWLMHGKTVRKD